MSHSWGLRQSRLTAGRRWLARTLSGVADRIAPELTTQAAIQLPTEELFKLPDIGRVDFEPLREGRVKIRYSALDPIWGQRSQEPEGMIPLRDHIMRLSGVAEELAIRGCSEDWHAVVESLHLAASLKELSADTDVNGDSFMCGTAADFDEAHSEVAAKYLAGVIVFHLAWGAYEWAVEIASRPLAAKQSRGARGRDLIFRVFGDKHFPHLRSAVFDALDLSSRRCLNFGTREMRRMLAAGSLAGIAAEYLREFRNALAHGTLEKPKPEDWGKGSDYAADDDPALRQFQANTRLTLLLIQILMRFASESEELTAWFSEPQPATLVLTQLHCSFQRKETEPLPLPGAPLVRWQDHHFY